MVVLVYSFLGPSLAFTERGEVRGERRRGELLGGNRGLLDRNSPLSPRNGDNDVDLVVVVVVVFRGDSSPCRVLLLFFFFFLFPLLLSLSLLLFLL